jgi:hypothetical protein
VPFYSNRDLYTKQPGGWLGGNEGVKGWEKEGLTGDRENIQLGLFSCLGLLISDQTAPQTAVNGVLARGLTTSTFDSLDGWNTSRV